MIDPGQRLLPRLSARAPWLPPAAILVLLAAFALLDRRPPQTPGTPPLNSEPLLETIANIEPDAHNPVRSVLRIMWTSCTGAETYEVRFWSQDMREVGRYRAGRTNSVMLDLEEVWRPIAPSHQLRWRVVALAHERDLAASDLQSLRLP